MDSLASLRRRIDILDDRILDLLNARARMVARVYTCKRKAEGGPLAVAFVPAREAEIFRRLAGRNRGPFPAAGVRLVFREIISACRSLEGAFKVVAAGDEGSAVYRAARDCFGGMARLLPSTGVSAVQKLLAGGSADYGVVPASALKRFAGGRFESCAILKGASGANRVRFVVLGCPREPLI
ncbi:MAG: chorismate mutase [bacterium]